MKVFQFSNVGKAMPNRSLVRITLQDFRTLSESSNFNNTIINGKWALRYHIIEKEYVSHVDSM